MAGTHLLGDWNLIDPVVKAAFSGDSNLVGWLVGNTLVAIGIAIAAILVDRYAKRPALSHLLWVLVLIKLVSPPVAPLGIGVNATWFRSLSLHSHDAASIVDGDDLQRFGALGSALGALAVDGPETTFTPLVVWAGVWLAGSLVMLLWILRASRRVHRLIERRGRFDITGTRQLAALCPPGKKTPPPVWLVDAVVSPMLVSPLFRRFGGEVRIVFPKRLWSSLDEDARAVLLLHEWEHFRRQDWIVRFIEVTTLTAMWWHPLVWIAKLQIEDCEERCCDMAASIGSDRSPRVYAEAILRTLDFLCEPVEKHHAEIEARPIASGVGHLPKLQHRLRQILKPTATIQIGRSGIVIISLMLAMLPFYPVVVVKRPSSGVEIKIPEEIETPSVLRAGSKVVPEPVRRPLVQ
ncbi:M56 family metallopeptidase [Rubripirellula reticaptiva]|uniref:Regulatory protein BlaR1 n=1 Tax=Rubripirellula reticaptiva TaxID=2528013 RepID=A0A5C6F8F4_9BACT|nr:M56 family metallopeptidase [Rubripirellula reticaptiva]TWU57565.1 Regulatory protein BlaR1 [Rubripirellula reticaptiva]